MAASSCGSILGGLGGTLFPSALYLVMLIMDVIDVDQDVSKGMSRTNGMCVQGYSSSLGFVFRIFPPAEFSLCAHASILGL